MPKPIEVAKRVIIHLGPHRTGSTAIQRCLTANRVALAELGILFLHSSTTHEAAKLLANEDFDSAESILRSVSQTISTSIAGIVILSQEDFCGDLPGRSRKKAIYPKLMKNLRVIARALMPHQVTFAIFERNEAQWLRSCYHQHLKYRTQFCRFEVFREHFTSMPNWQLLLEKPRATFHENFITIPYKKEPAAGITALLRIVGLEHANLLDTSQIENRSPDSTKIAILERINSLSSFKETAWFTKSLVLRDWLPQHPTASPTHSASGSDCLASMAFPELVLRAKRRISSQSIDDILPDADVGLDDYVIKTIPIDNEPPNVSRTNIRDQSAILDYHLRGKSELAKLNALTISYLRRDTEHSGKARKLFHRIWEEKGTILVNELSTRWLISTLQTFLDHGVNEAQKEIGVCGYFYANMMKIYEGERTIEGLEQDGLIRATRPQTPNKFPGLDRFEVGGTDLLLNTNALALDLAMRDDIAGLVLLELLLRVKHSGNVFTRMDRSRQANNIEVDGFEDTWSFYVKPI